MGGVMTSMRKRLVSSVSFVALLLKHAAGCSVKPLLPLLVAPPLKRQPYKNLEFF